MSVSIKTPFSDREGPDSVPTKAPSAKYDAETVPNTPMRDGGLYPEVTFDTHWGDPHKGSPPNTKTPFSDAQD